MTDKVKETTLEQLESKLEGRYKTYYATRMSVDTLLKGLGLAIKHLRNVSYDQNRVKNGKIVSEIVDALLELKKLSEFLGQEVEYPKVVTKTTEKIFPPHVDD